MPTSWPPPEMDAWVRAQYAAHPDDTYPPERSVYAAFDLTPYDEVRVVLLGQDPYPNPGDANGLCFSVTPGQPLPTSMKNIHHALREDGFAAADGHGDLTSWARQGVFLFNTALTVRGKAGAHLLDWRGFTRSVLELLNERRDPVVFVLWGKKAQGYKEFLDEQRHEFVEAPHPAARGTDQRAFREAQSFTRANTLLTGSEIDWTIR